MYQTWEKIFMKNFNSSISFLQGFGFRAVNEKLLQSRLKLVGSGSLEMTRTRDDLMLVLLNESFFIFTSLIGFVEQISWIPFITSFHRLDRASFSLCLQIAYTWKQEMLRVACLLTRTAWMLRKQEHKAHPGLLVLLLCLVNSLNGDLMLQMWVLLTAFCFQPDLMVCFCFCKDLPLSRYPGL